MAQNVDKVSNILRQYTDSRGEAFSRIAERIDALYTKPIPPIPQEPSALKRITAKDIEKALIEGHQIVESQFAGNNIHYIIANAQLAADQDVIDKSYRPLLEQAEVENARLKEERDNWAKKANEWSAKSIEKINALESQLKSMVELDKNQSLPEMPNLGEMKASSAYGYSQQDMLKAGFLKVKALASQKGETK